jgi:hypothetical protein
MNVFIINSKTYYLESIWNNKKESITDTNNKKLIYPHAEKFSWTNKENFIEILKEIMNCLNSHKTNTQVVKGNVYKNMLKLSNVIKKPINEIFTQCPNKYFLEYRTPQKCLICGEKNISKGLYLFANHMWEDSLIHYMDKHNIEPSVNFMEYIYIKAVGNSRAMCENGVLKLKCGINKKVDNDIYYVKLDSNQIMIMDALMYHGGYTKKYSEKNSDKYRYSEHSGILNFNDNALDTIIVFGNTTRIDTGDDDIYLPRNMKESEKYEYLFHTHPPTPKPGGRAVDGIPLELPSIGDIIHFMDHFNYGKTIGSIVVAPEGMYNIRKLNFDPGNITIDEDKLFTKINKVSRSVQAKVLKKYGKKFTTSTFYSKISQDTSFIKEVNLALKEFNMYIDFFPRRQDGRGKWIIDDIYLPIIRNK